MSHPNNPPPFPPPPPPSLLPLADAARIGGIRGEDPGRPLRAAGGAGELAIERVGGHSVVARAELSRWLESRRVEPSAAKHVADDPREEARAAVQRAAIRIA